MRYLSRIGLKRRDQRRYRAWQKRITRDLIKRKKIKKVVGSEVRIVPPEIFSFAENYEETVSCLEALRKAVLTKPPPGARVRTFIDFAPIRSITVAGALALAAEIDRWRRVRHVNLQPRHIAAWHPGVRAMLSSLGFFDLLGVKLKPEMMSEDDGGPIVVLPFISSTSLDVELIAGIRNYMQEIAQVFRQDPSVYAALTEAAYNSTLHAYPENHRHVYPVLRRRWWATCSYDQEANCVKFLVFDQGVGIPETLPRWSHWEEVRRLLAKLQLGNMSLASVVKDDAQTIRAAIDVSRTSLSGGHGQGLRDVTSPVDLIEGAKVRMLSGRGSVTYTRDEGYTLREHAQHLGGTLIEWTIPAGKSPHEVESA